MKRSFNFFGPQQTRVLALIYLVLGLVLCFSGAAILLNTVRILAVLLVMYGAWLLYLYFTRKIPAFLGQGIPYVLIGLVISFSPQTLISIFPVIIGMIIIFNSIWQMQKSFLLKNAGSQMWLSGFVISILMMAGGLVLILRPIQIIHWIMRAAGIFLCAEAIFMLISSFQDQKYLH